MAIAIPALAQDRPESILPPGFGEPAASPTPSPNPSPAPSGQSGEGSTVVETGPAGLTPLEAADAMVVEVAPPIELPADARRDPSSVGPLPAAQTGFGTNM